MSGTVQQREHWRLDDYDWNRHTLSAEVSSDANKGSGPQQQTDSSGSSPRQPGSQGSEAAPASASMPVVLDSLHNTGGLKRHIPLTCQVEGCSRDLSGAKEYYQRYRICEDHLKLSSLIKDNIPQRFCQQCGRFHVLADFDGDKRSCRARLSLHNNRRRKRASGAGLSQARTRRAAPVEAFDVAELNGGPASSEGVPAMLARRSRSTRRRLGATISPDPSGDEGEKEAAPVEPVPMSEAQQADASLSEHDLEVSHTYMKDFSPEVVAVLQSLATPAGQPSQGRPEGMGEGGHLQGRSSANSTTRGEAGVEQLIKAPSDMLALEPGEQLHEEAMVRFLSEPAYKRLASIGSLQSTGSGALAAGWRPQSIHPPATLDWSGQRGARLDADTAALREYFSQRSSGEGTSLSVARSLTSALSLAHGGPHASSSDLADALFKCASDPIYPPDQAAAEGWSDPPRMHAPLMSPQHQELTGAGSLRQAWAPQMAAAQPQAQPQQQHQQQPLQQGQRGTQSATWPQSWPHARRMVHHQLGQTLARHPQAPLAQHMPPAVAGQAQLGWDQGDYEPPLQFRRGPTADFWYARQAAQDSTLEGPMHQGAEALYPLPQQQQQQQQQQIGLQGQPQLQSQQALGSSPTLLAPTDASGPVFMTSLPAISLPGIKEEGVGQNMTDIFAPLGGEQLLASPGPQFHASALSPEPATASSLRQIGSGFQLLERARAQHPPIPHGPGIPQEPAPLPAFDASLWPQHMEAVPQMQQSPPAGQLHMQSTSGPVPPHVASEYAYRALAQDHAGSLQHTLNPSGMVPTPARRPSVTFADNLISPPMLAMHEDVSDLDPHHPGHAYSRMHTPQLGEAWLPVRASAKMATVRPEQLPGTIRGHFMHVLQSPWADHTLQGTIRPGCLHLILAAIEPDFQHRKWDAAAAAKQLIALDPAFWREQLVLLQLPGSAVMLERGRITHHFTGRELAALQPQAPDPQTCAVLAGDPFILPVPEGCTRPATVGPWAGMEPKHVRLVGRFNGHLAVDHDLAGVHEQERLPLPTQNIRGSGLLWLEVERDGILSTAVPVVVSTDMDVVEELSDLLDDLAMGSITEAGVEHLLLKIGTVLEFAEPFVGQMPSLDGNPKEEKQTEQPAHSNGSCYDERHSSKEYKQAMTECATVLLAECCMRSWPALASKVLPVAALGSDSFGELVEAAERHCEHAGSLLCAAVYQGSLSMTGLLLDLQDATGHIWDLTRPKGGDTPLHWAARLDDEGCMAGLLLTRCHHAHALWTTLENAAGETPASIEQRLATTGRHWHYLDPAERASVEERLERTRLGTNILDTPGTDRTISLALSDHSVFHPLSPSPSLHFTHADHANSMMRLRRAFQESAGLLLQSSGSLQLPEQSCALEDPALEEADEGPRQSKRPGRRQPSRQRPRAAPPRDDRAQLSRRLSSAPSSLLTASARKDMQAVAEEMTLAMRQPTPRTSPSQGVASLAQTAPMQMDCSWPRRKSMEQLWTPFAAANALPPSVATALSHSSSAPAASGEARGRPEAPASDLLLPSLSAEHGDRSLFRLGSSRSVTSNQLEVPKSSFEALAGRRSSRPPSGSASWQSKHATPSSQRRSRGPPPNLPSQSETDEEWAPPELEPRLSEDLTAAVEKVVSQREGSGLGKGSHSQDMLSTNLLDTAEGSSSTGLYDQDSSRRSSDSTLAGDASGLPWPPAHEHALDGMPVEEQPCQAPSQGFHEDGSMSADDPASAAALVGRRAASSRLPRLHSMQSTNADSLADCDVPPSRPAALSELPQAPADALSPVSESAGTHESASAGESLPESPARHGADASSPGPEWQAAAVSVAALADGSALGATHPDVVPGLYAPELLVPFAGQPQVTSAPQSRRDALQRFLPGMLVSGLLLVLLLGPSLLRMGILSTTALAAPVHLPAVAALCILIGAIAGAF